MGWERLTGVRRGFLPRAPIHGVRHGVGLLEGRRLLLGVGFEGGRLVPEFRFGKWSRRNSGREGE